MSQKTLLIIGRLWYTCAMLNKRDARRKIRVFVLSADSIFGLGLKELLQTRTDVEVVDCDTCGEQSADRIRELLPDIVIVSSTCSDCESQLLCWNLLNNHHQTRILKLNLEDTSACLFRGETLRITGVDDLVSCIREQHPADLPADAPTGSS